MSELKGKDLHDVHKFVYMANEYADKTIDEIAGLFVDMAPIDVSVAVWRAQDLGMVELSDGSRQAKVIIHDLPKKWEFGPEAERLISQIKYTFKRTARDEKDIEEHYLMNMMQGYKPVDVMISMKFLMNQKFLGSYTVEDITVLKPATKKKPARIDKAVYTFYSIYDNLEQEWGRKQFKDAEKLAE